MIWRVKRPLDKDAGGAHIGNMGTDEDAAPEAIRLVPTRQIQWGVAAARSQRTSDAGH